MTAYAHTLNRPPPWESHRLRRIAQVGGLITAVVVVAFVVAALVMRANSLSTVHTGLVQQRITITPHMSPALVAKTRRDPWVAGTAAAGSAERSSWAPRSIAR